MYEESIGKTYEIAGPDVFTFNNIVRLVNHSAFADVRVLSMPDIVAKLYGRLLEGVNVPLLNRLRAPVIYNADMVAQTYVDQVPDGKLPGLAVTGSRPHAAAECVGPADAAASSGGAGTGEVSGCGED